MTTVSSTPLKYKKFNFLKPVLNVSGIPRDKTTKMTAAIPKPKTIDMICEAITVVGSEKKGASFQAIKNFVIGKYSDSENIRLQQNLKRALLKGVETGVLERPNASKNANGAVGFFVVSKKKPMKKASEAKVVKKPREKKPTEPVSDSEVTINKGKKKYKELKQNLSDTEIDIKIKKQKIKKAVPLKKSEDKAKESKKPDKGKALPVQKTTKQNPEPITKEAIVLKENLNAIQVIPGPSAKKTSEKKNPTKEKVTKEKKGTEKSDKTQPKTIAKKKGPIK